MDADELVRELVPLMEPGDVLAHPFTRHPGGFVCAATHEVHPESQTLVVRGEVLLEPTGHRVPLALVARTDFAEHLDLVPDAVRGEEVDLELVDFPVFADDLFNRAGIHICPPD